MCVSYTARFTSASRSRSSRSDRPSGNDEPQPPSRPPPSQPPPPPAAQGCSDQTQQRATAANEQQQRAMKKKKTKAWWDVVKCAFELVCSTWFESIFLTFGVHWRAACATTVACFLLLRSIPFIPRERFSSVYDLAVWRQFSAYDPREGITVFFDEGIQRIVNCCIRFVKC